MNRRAVVTSKGQVTIPKPVREAVGIRESDLIEFEVRRGEIVLRPAGGSFLARFGSIAPRDRPENWKRIRKQVMEDVAKRGARSRRA